MRRTGRGRRPPFAALIGLCVLLAPEASTAAPRAQPNVIFILADDLGYADIGAYGQREIQTPNLDRFARDGMLFTDAYAGSAVCGPSRAALFLGLHNGHNPNRHNPGQARGWDRTTAGDPPLPEDGPTSAKVLEKSPADRPRGAHGQPDVSAHANGTAGGTAQYRDAQR